MKKNSHSFLIRFFLIFSILSLFIVPLSAIFPSLSDIKLYDNVIRLHVLANSNEEIDQTVKLSVRDEILKAAAEILEGVTDRALAEELLSENLTKLEAAAENLLSEKGFTYTAHVTLTKERYPARSYGGISLPSGEYTSLRILLGEAAGENWWCVLFPTLCNPYGGISFPTDEELIEAGLTPSQVKIITGNTPSIKIKFRLLELISNLFS